MAPGTGPMMGVCPGWLLTFCAAAILGRRVAVATHGDSKADRRRVSVRETRL